MATTPDPDEVLRSTDGKDKFQRISRLLISGGTTLLREVFDQICPPVHLPLKLKDATTKKQLKAAKLTMPQRNCLYPSPGTYGESKDFDITLLFALLRTICNLPRPSKGWDILPAPADHSLVAELARIKHYRNTVYGHVNGNMEITDDKFLQLWKDIGQALIGVAAYLGSPSKCDWQTKIEKLLKDPLTAEDERNVQELQEWYKKDEDIKKSLDQLVDTTQKGKDSIERMEKNVEEIKKYLSELYELRPNSCENCTCTDAAILPVKLSCEIYAHSDQQGDLCGMSVNGDASRATAQEVLNQIAKSYLQIVESSTKKECNEFMEYLTRMGKVLVVDVIKGSLMIKVGCRSVQILSDLYIDFLTGHLNALAREHLVTERVLTKFALMEAKLTTNISENEYRNCRKQLKVYAVLEPKVLDLKNRRDKLQEKFLEWVKVRKKIRSSLERPLQDRRMYSCSTFHWLVALVAVGLMVAISTFDVLAADEDIGLGVVICIGLWVCLGLALSATIASKPGSNKENDLGDDKNALQKVSSDACLLGKCVASLSICCRNHTEQVLTSRVMASEFPFLIDILRESGSEFHRESKSMLQALIKRELNIHSKGFQSLPTTNREILQELQEGPSQDEIQEMIVDFIKVEFDKNSLKFHQTSPFISHFH